MPIVLFPDYPACIMADLILPSPVPVSGIWPFSFLCPAFLGNSKILHNRIRHTVRWKPLNAEHELLFDSVYSN